MYPARPTKFFICQLDIDFVRHIRNTLFDSVDELKRQVIDKMNLVHGSFVYILKNRGGHYHVGCKYDDCGFGVLFGTVMTSSRSSAIGMLRILNSRHTYPIH